MPAWVSKFKRSKKDKKASVDALDQQVLDEDPSAHVEKHESLAPPPPPTGHAGMLTPPSSPIPTHHRLRTAHSHNDLPATAHPNDMWTSIAQLESELVARYGRGAVPQLEALRERMQNEHEQPMYQPIEWADGYRPSQRTRTETLPSRTRPVPPRAFVDDLDVCSGQSSPIQPSIEEGDSDDAAAYLQALGLEPSTPKEAKPKTRVHAQSTNSHARHGQPARSATLPTYPAEAASIVNSPSPEVLEQYMASRHPRLDYITPRAHSNDPSVSSRSASPMHTPDSPAARSQSSRRDLPPRPPPPNTSVPYAPVTSPARLYTQDSPVHHSPASFSRISPRPQQSPMSLTVPSPHALRSAGSSPNTTNSQLALPLVRVRITCPPQRGALRQLPALVLLYANARASFAAATWAQMVTYCARNAGVSIARRGGQGTLSISVEERMAELTTPGGGRGVGDDEVGFGLGYYVSVEMMLEGEAEHHVDEGSVPVATMSVPLPTTLGEIAIVFRERKDIRKALS